MAYKKQTGGPKMYRKDGALPMKSPMKNINNMKAYSKPGDAVQFGDGIKMYGSPNEMETPTYMKSPNEMKSSGFKMKSGSPFQRNFGVGASPVKAAKPDYPDIDGDGNDTESMKQAAADKKGPLEMASPMKEKGVYESILDEETGKLNTEQVSRDKIKNITAQRNALQKQMKGVERFNEDGTDNQAYLDLESQLSDLTEASRNFTLTGDDVTLGTSEEDVAEMNKSLKSAADETGAEFTPTTTQKMNMLGKAKKTEQGYSKGIYNELQKDNAGRTSQDFYQANPEEQLIDEDAIFKGNVKFNDSRYGKSEGQVTEQMMKSIQNKVDAFNRGEGPPLSEEDKVIQKTYISGLGKGAGSEGNWNYAAYQDGASGNAVIDGDENSGVTKVNNEFVPSTDENTNTYMHPDSGKMVLFQDLPANLQGKMAAEGVKEEATINASNAADAKEIQDEKDKLALFNSPEQKKIRSDYYDAEPDPDTMSKRKYKKAMELWKQKGSNVML